MALTKLYKKITTTTVKYEGSLRKQVAMTYNFVNTERTPIVVRSGGLVTEGSSFKIYNFSQTQLFICCQLRI